MEAAPAKRVIRAIEDSFPIVEINRLAVPERNAFKPIYQMHKWFARRASCVFRAILLGCLKPLPLDDNGEPTKTGAEVIMEEFYKDHRNDPDTNGRVILDPFMGGGTTIVEALRLGCRVIGIDLNPVAWFIVKTEVEPVDLGALKNAFGRLAARQVAWSGKSLRETLLDQYRTQCPCCGADDADTIYTFWVKSAICTACGKQVPLFKDYLIVQKSPSIRYFRDVTCPRCPKTFDWEVEPAALVAEPALQVNSPTYSAGIGRSTVRWAYSSDKEVSCPWCGERVTARPSKAKRERKKVPLSVLLCPFCEVVWQWRGEVPESVACPVCRREYNPLSANVPRKGEFLCSCGHTDDIIRSIRRLPEDQLLPIHPYAIEGYCARCGGDAEDEDEAATNANGNLFDQEGKGPERKPTADHDCRIRRNAGKFFKRIHAGDLRRIEQAIATWEQEKGHLPYPKQTIPVGEKTKSGLLAHHYRYWHQMFHPRQLLCLSTLLSAIAEEAPGALRHVLLLTLSSSTDTNNLFTRYMVARESQGGQTAQGVFARHDFQPKATICEQNVWGLQAGGIGTFSRRFAVVLAGIRFQASGYEVRYLLSDGKRIRSEVVTESIPCGTTACLTAGDSREALAGIRPRPEFVITDPPYAGNVNYSELSDFYYVWLKAGLPEAPEFAPEIGPKAAEIIVNPTRGHSVSDFGEGLTQVFRSAAASLDDGGLLVFTFHHAEGKTWTALLSALFEAGFIVEAVYPIQGDVGTALPMMEGANITYDLIHVCGKRRQSDATKQRPWASVRQEIRRRARAEIVAIEAGRYGKEPLPPADVNIILIGKCLELYSRHYGTVIDHEGKPFPLHEALKQIRDIADQMVERERPLPAELEDIDPESRIYLRALCRVKEVKSDDVHKATRGILERSELIEAGLMTKMRAGRGRSYEVKQPAERLPSLMERYRERGDAHQGALFAQAGSGSETGGLLFIDRVHLLLGLAEAGENLIPWLDRFRSETPQIRAALEYLEGQARHLAPACRKVLDLLEVGPLLKGVN